LLTFNVTEKAQLKNLTPAGLIKALERDGFTRGTAVTQGGKKSKTQQIAYRKKTATSLRYVTVHYHPNKTYGKTGIKLLQYLFEAAGWDKADLYRLGIL
jgi:hypothetical protein